MLAQKVGLVVAELGIMHALVMLTRRGQIAIAKRIGVQAGESPVMVRGVEGSLKETKIRIEIVIEGIDMGTEKVGAIESGIRIVNVIEMVTEIVTGTATGIVIVIAIAETTRTESVNERIVMQRARRLLQLKIEVCLQDRIRHDTGMAMKLWVNGEDRQRKM